MADVKDILNAIKSSASESYQNRIPTATKDNIATVGNAITSYTSTMNEFLSALVNRIGMTYIQSKSYKNPFSPFKKGMLEYGQDVEEIFVNIAKAQTFDQSKSESDLFVREIPDVKAIFHRQNRTDFYKATTSEDMLRRAFLSSNGINDLVSSIVESLYTGDEYDEFILMKQLITDYYQKGNFVTHEINVTDEASAKDTLRLFRQISNDLTFMNTSFNKQGVATHTPIEEQVLFISTELDAKFDVNVLAYAFNMSKAEYLQKRILFDNITADADNVNSIQAVICDKDFFQVWDTNYKAETIYNPQGLYWNHFLHHWQILSTSQFANAVAFYSPIA